MKLLQIISVFALAFLVLLSSSSFMVGIHFCKGRVKHLALFTKADACEKEKELPPCHKPLATPCCDDETVIHEGDGFARSFSDITISPFPVSDLALPLVIVAEIIPSEPASWARYQHYDPPLRSYDLTVANLVFLI